MQNKKQEIELAIESKVRSIAELINDYEDLGGKVTHLTMLKYDDSNYHMASVNGFGYDLQDLILGNEDIQKLLVGRILHESVGEFIDLEEEE